MKPKHMAFIMDGNRRYAKKQGLSNKEGYKKGMMKFIELVSFQVKHGILETSFYALSCANYEKRPVEELKAIGELISTFASEKSKFKEFFEKNKIGLRVFGDLDPIVKKAKTIGGREEIKEMEEGLKQLKEWENNVEKPVFWVNIGINYDGREEIVNACREISRKVAKGEIKDAKINEDLIKQHLRFSSKSPDLIVRTGNSPRLSGFLLWDASYSEIYLMKKLWPEFNESDFLHIIDWFGNIKRNNGA